MTLAVEGLGGLPLRPDIHTVAGLGADIANELKKRQDDVRNTVAN